MDIWRPNVLVLGPGSIKGLLIVSALSRLVEENNFLEGVKTYLGISVGAAISLLMVCGYTPNEIIDIAMSIDLTEDFFTIKIDDVRKNLGLISNKTVEESLKRHVEAKLGMVPTMKQLFNLTGFNLCITAFNLDKLELDFFDKEDDISCVDAAMLSMSMPFIMQPRTYKGCVYTDGALGNPYPISKFDTNGNNVLGLYITNDEDFHSSRKNPSVFLHHIVHASMKMIRDMEIKNASGNVKHIVLKSNVKDSTGLSITLETKQQMIRDGYKTADKFLKIISDPEKYQLELQEGEEIPFE